MLCYEDLLMIFTDLFIQFSAYYPILLIYRNLLNLFLLKDKEL